MDDDEQPPVDPPAPETEPTPKNAAYTVLSKYSDPINDMIFVNQIRAEAGLPPLTIEGL